MPVENNESDTPQRSHVSLPILKSYIDIYKIIQATLAVLDCLSDNLKKLIVHVSLGQLNRFTQDNKTDLNHLLTEFFVFRNLCDSIFDDFDANGRRNANIALEHTLLYIAS